jgi:phosphoribosylaminoimidazolecarboxamide formyltransferase/IMP cyclohydrolase
MPLALISVYDKKGLEQFVQRLARLGWTFLASGGTSAALRGAGIEPVDIAEYTGSSELLSGRVKTLHPAIHAGILARPEPADLEELRAHGYKPIDLVVVNLYPFEKTAAQANASEAEIIEQIDIGGVALIRAAAKNFARVCVICDPEDYERIALEAESGGIGAETRRELAAKAFAHTAAYDRAIAEWFAQKAGGAAEREAATGAALARDSALAAAAAHTASSILDGVTAEEDGILPASFEFRGIVERTLRYGENPHQKAFFVIPVGDWGGSFVSMRKEGSFASEGGSAVSPIVESGGPSHGQPQVRGSIGGRSDSVQPQMRGPLGGRSDSIQPKVRGPLGGQVLGGKELSYNNLLDLDAAWRAVLSFEQPAAVIVKHLSPCGAAEAENLKDAYEAALACDPVSAFGGIVALNRPLDVSTAEALRELFLECVAAPSFEEDARDVLKAKKNLRLVEADPLVFSTLCKELRSAAGGLLVQEPDRGDPIDTTWRVVSARQPTEAEMESLRFAWKLVQHVKSNAIVLAKGHASVGIGGGQTNRVDAVRQACERAGARAKGAVMASDAFFPFADGIEAAAEAGVTAVVHPGGSVRDVEVLAAADRLGLAVVHTGVRHFRH